MSAPNDQMAEIRATFFLECEDLLEALQEGIQALDDGEGDAETINVVFRSVHSIKGGAGAFGLDELVQFAHRFETVLDAARAERLAPDHADLQVFFRACDILGDLVSAGRDGDQLDAEHCDATLKALEELVEEEAEDEVVDFAPMALSLDLGSLADGAPGTALPGVAPTDFEAPADDVGTVSAGDAVGDAPPGQVTPEGATGFKIDFAPHDGLYTSGNEPLHLLRLLHELGEYQARCDTSALSSLEALQPEQARLAWEIYLETDESEEAIREIFDFVEDVCDLSILPISSQDCPPTTLLSSPTDRPPTVPSAALPEAGSAHGAPSEAPQDPNAAPERAAVNTAATSQNTSAATTAARPRPTVRVDLERVDRLVNLVGELVINQAMISQSVEKAGLLSDPTISSGLDAFMN